MPDQPDKAVPRDEPLTLMLSDPPATSEEQGEPSHEKVGRQTQESLNELVADLNSFSAQIKAGKLSLTPEYIQNSDRETLHAKKLELETLAGLYQAKHDEIEKSQLSEKNLTNLSDQKFHVDQNMSEIRTIFQNTRFEVASAKVKELETIFQKIENEKAGVTEEYLRIATKEILEAKRTHYTGLYSKFVEKYSQIVQADLTSEEISQVESHWARAKQLSETFDKFLLEQISKRDTSIENPPNEQTDSQVESKRQAQLIEDLKRELEELRQRNKGVLEGEKLDRQPESSQQPSDPSQFEALRKTIQELIYQGKQERKDNDERMKSLEEKVGTAAPQPREQQKHDDEMVGDPQDDVIIEQTGTVGLKIGTIDLPIFSGNLADWESFKELFEDLVDKSKKMTKGVKFWQLHTHLKGAALDTIRGYQISGSNYDSAWEDLKKRYDRKDELIDEYLRKFFETKPIEHRANVTSLRKIVDGTNQMLRGLPNLGASVFEWDPIVNFIICSKLNDELKTDWKQKKAMGKKQTSDLLEFLEEKAFEVQPNQADRFSQMLRGDPHRKQPKKVFQINEKKTEVKDKKSKKECLICKGNHNIWDCNILKKESAKARSNIIKALGLCFKCLLKHRVGMCDNEECEYCGGPHNILLCYKKENEEKLKPLKPKNYQPAGAKNSNQSPGTSQQKDDWDDWDKSAVKKN